MRDTGFDWTKGPRWTVGEPAQRARRAATRNGRWVVVAAISAVAAVMSALAFTGVAAKGAALYPCAGAPPDAPQTMYPEKRIYLETQAWWTPMPGHSPDEPFQDRTGHIHVSACVPLYQTVSGGTLHLDLKWQEHMMQGVNGQGAPVPTNFIVNIEGVFKGPNLRNLGLWPGVPCTTMQCEGWVSADFDYSKAPSGWGNLNPFIQDFFTDCPGGAPNCRQLRTLNHWPVNFVTSNPPITNDSVLAPDAYTGGESWFTPDGDGGSHYARTFVARSEISKLWNIDTGELVPKSGVVHITISGEKDGNRATIDPKLHAMPPLLGTVLVDEPAGTAGKLYKSYDLAIDTTKLTDGAHRLMFQNVFKRAAGEQSGVIVLPFLVANSTSPPAPTTSPTTTTTTPPTAGGTTTSPTTTAPPPAGSQNPKCRPTCHSNVPRLQRRAKHTMVTKLRARLARERAVNTKLRRQLDRLRKELEQSAQRGR